MLAEMINCAGITHLQIAVCLYGAGVVLMKYSFLEYSEMEFIARATGFRAVNNGLMK